MTKAEPAPPPEAPAAPAPPRRAPRVLTASLEHARHGIGSLRAASIDDPSPSLGARLGWGAALPVAIARRVLADPALRRRYLGLKLRQLFFVCGMTAAAAFLFVDWEADRRDPMVGAPAASSSQLPSSSVVAPGVVVTRETGRKTTVKVGERSFAVEGDEDEALRAPARRVPHVLQVLSSLYGILVTCEWIVIALSREHDDQLGSDAAELLGLPRDDPPARPRVRLDLGWLWRRPSVASAACACFSPACPSCSRWC